MSKFSMLIRLLCLVLTLFIAHTAKCQIYVEGIAPAEYDTIHNKILRAFKATKFDSALVLTDRFNKYWTAKLKEDNSQPVLQNYYYSVIQNMQPKIKLKRVSKKELQSYYKLEQRIERDLANKKLVFPIYYSVASELKRLIDRDYESSIIYSNKSIEQRRAADTLNHKEIAREIIIKGYSLSSLQRFDEAKNCFNEALAIKKKHIPKDTLQILFSIYPLGVNGFRSNNYEEGLKSFNEGFEIAKDFLPKTHDLYIGFARASALGYIEVGKLDKALERAHLGLEAAKLKNTGSQISITPYYTDLAKIHFQLGQIAQAQLYADTAIILIENTGSKTALTVKYQTKAALQTDINEQIRINNKALEICPEDPNCSPHVVNVILNNLGNAYARKGNLEIGLNYLLKSKELKEKDYAQYGIYLPATYRALADIYQNQGKIDLAIKLQKKALATVKEFRPDTSFYVAFEKSFLGSLYLKRGDLNLAEPMLLDADRMLEKQIGGLNKEYISNYKYLTSLYIQKEEFDLALKYGYTSYDKILTKDSDTHQVIQDPMLQLANIYSEKNLIDSSLIILNELLTLSGFEEFRNDKINPSVIPIHKQWFSYQALSKAIFLEDELVGDEQKFIIGKILTGIDLIDKLREQYFFEKSEQEFQLSTKLFFNWSLKKLVPLYSNSNDENILRIIFQCIEKSKSIALNRNFTRYKATANKSIPDEIIEREKSIIIFYENAYSKYENNIENDSLSNLYVNEMYELQDSKEKFLDTLKTKYPEYYNARYDQQVIKLEEIENLAENDKRTFIISHIIDSLVYQFVITPNSTNFSVSNSIEIIGHIDRVKNIVSQPANSQNELDFVNTKLEFINSSFSIYESLFKSNNVDSLTFDITIISNDKLAQFPFDVLLTSKPAADANYRSMPFLIRSHAINYLGSATQYVQVSNNKSYTESAEYAGFAPNYKATPIANDSIDQFRSTVSLNPLLYNFEEVSKTSSLFDGIEYIGDKATESEFRNINSPLAILHLAMHTTIDDRFPLDSYLNFSVDSTLEDSRLYVHEIAKMNLNHNLVVLSACETNIGSEVKGEGILGIARAFQIASCPNLIVSNWLIDDRSAGEIIYSFFKGIKANLSPAKSLRDAKLEFLENSSTIKSHPSYWAGFSYYGNPSLHPEKSNDNKFLVLGGFSVLLLFFISILLSRKAK